MSGRGAGAAWRLPAGEGAGAGGGSGGEAEAPCFSCAPQAARSPRAFLLLGRRTGFAGAPLPGPSWGLLQGQGLNTAGQAPGGGGVRAFALPAGEVGRALWLQPLGRGAWHSDEASGAGKLSLAFSGVFGSSWDEASPPRRAWSGPGGSPLLLLPPVRGEVQLPASGDTFLPPPRPICRGPFGPLLLLFLRLSWLGQGALGRCPPQALPGSARALLGLPA